MPAREAEPAAATPAAEPAAPPAVHHPPKLQAPSRIQSKKSAQKKQVDGGAAVGAVAVAGELPQRYTRVAGPYRSMCGGVHLLHRCFFDALARNAPSLSASHGMISLNEKSDRSCSVILRLHDGGGGSTICHRIARYCAYMSQAGSGENQKAEGRKNGDASKYVKLQIGQEFLVTRHGKPFHCKIQRPSKDREQDGDSNHHSKTSALPTSLELRLSGVSRASVVGLLEEGARFGPEEDTVSARSKADEAHKLIALARECISLVGKPASQGAGAPGEGSSASPLAFLEYSNLSRTFHESNQGMHAC